jgi:hypothetical protein
MSLPKIVYHPLTVDVTLQCSKGPVGFACHYKSRVHDNVATSGLRERVFEGNDMLISFNMPFLSVTDDLPGWMSFAQWALAGGSFKFYPDAALSDYYNCVSDDEGLPLTYVAPGRYSTGFNFRIVPDSQAPADPGVVMKRFYGVTS